MSPEELKKAEYFASWWVWYPDLALDLMAPKEGGIKLHLDQRIFMRAGTRFFSEHGCFPRGYGKCVAGDTLLYTSDGMKEIGSYFNYQDDNIETEYSLNVNVINRNGKPATSRRGIYSGYKPTKKITTSEGYSLEGTYVHPILVMNSDGNVEFKKMKDISIGDYAVISRNNNLYGNSLDIDQSNKLDAWIKTLSNQQSSHLNIRKLPNQLTRDLAYFFGLLIGDGCLTRDNCIIFSNNDDDIISSYFRIVKENFGSIIAKRGKFDYVISDKYLRKYLEYCGLVISDSHTKQIPECILNAPKDIQASFLSGLFDTDGGVEKAIVSYCTVSFELVKQVQLMLLQMGIISRIKNRNGKGDFSHYLLIISGKDTELFYEQVGFCCKRKQDRLNVVASKKHNSNKDIIPYQNSNVCSVFEKLKHFNKEMYSHFYHVLSGNNNLTYDKLEKILCLNRFDSYDAKYHFENLSKENYYFAEIVSIEDSMNHVYDLNVPDTNSFVSNGFVSHNTFLEFANMVIVCIRYPNIELALTAQTKENAAALLKDKYNELIRYYPMLEKEIVKTSFIKGDALIQYRNGAKID